MTTRLFVDKHSIVRRIWGKADTVLFVFAGAAAEFALNKAVDWLYFTGRLPADPLARLFSTVAYARKILFSENNKALEVIDQITAIHKDVENARGQTIPDWAYRDVLFLLIDYSIRSFEILERPLSNEEKEDVFRVFYKVGLRMQLAGLPNTYDRWLVARNEHLQKNLTVSKFTADLFKQYKKHLGWLRFLLLKKVQAAVVPRQVKELLELDDAVLPSMLIRIYRWLRIAGLGTTARNALLPNAYKKQVMEMDTEGQLNKTP